MWAIPPLFGLYPRYCIHMAVSRFITSPLSPLSFFPLMTTFLLLQTKPPNRDFSNDLRHWGTCAMGASLRACYNLENLRSWERANPHLPRSVKRVCECGRILSIWSAWFPLFGLGGGGGGSACSPWGLWEGSTAQCRPEVFASGPHTHTSVY